MRPASNINPYALPLQLTPPGTLTAHGKFCLVLLCSQPDTVRRHPLRKTQTSTPLIKGSHTGTSPKPDITPAIADFRYRGPLIPRLHGLISILFFERFVNPFGFRAQINFAVHAGITITPPALQPPLLQ